MENYFTALSTLANSGTPLMWATMLHLLVGNTLIGILEGFLLAHFYQCKKRKVILIVIAANYVSAWAGHFLFSYSDVIVDITIENVKLWFYLSLLLAFVMTLLIEFPFFWYAVRDTCKSVSRTIKYLIIIHGISYLLLLVWYWMASYASLMNELETVTLSEINPKGDFTLYYITPDGTEVRSLNLDGRSESRAVSKVADSDKSRLLAVYPSSDGVDVADYDLYIRSTSNRDKDYKGVLVKPSFAASIPSALSEREALFRMPAFNGMDFGEVRTWDESSPWRFRTGFWPMEGIRCRLEASDRSVRYAQETPVVSWTICNAIQLEDDLVVFQLGDDQICLLQAGSKKTALITRGKGIVVIKAMK